jgi:DNA-directed RNA polymerase specialized sigma24 family protein
LTLPQPQETASLEQLMAGVLAMLVADREERLGKQDGRVVEPRKTELILFSSGFSYQQIGTFLDKKPDTVKKAISRARAKSNQKADDDG